ncbi:MAG: allophanate hydrolase subunit 1 [Rhizobium sp.]
MGSKQNIQPGAYRSPRFLDAGEAALVVEFGRDVDPDINTLVLRLDAALAARNYDGIRERVPTYRSLMIHYDPLCLARADLLEHVENCLQDQAADSLGSTHWTVPCCYEPPIAEDLEEVAGLLKCAADRFVATHVTAIYRAYMYGFSPGYTYLGGLPPEIAVPRRPSPRAAHAPGAILIGGGLCSISTFAMPTGWYVVGRTPERLYAPEREKQFLLEPGDTVTFEPVNAAAFMDLSARAAAGEIVARATLR